MNARDEAVEMIRRICPPHLSADEYGRILAEKFDAHRVENRTEAADWFASYPFPSSDSDWERGRDDTVAWVVRCLRNPDPRRPDVADATPEFFRLGHTYTREHHVSTIRFLVRYVDESPDGIGGLVAFGWRTEDGDVCASPFDSDDFTGWVDVTEGGDGR